MNCTSRWTSGLTSRCGIHYGYGASFPLKKAFKHWDGHLDVHPDVHLDVQFIMVIVLGLSLIKPDVAIASEVSILSKNSLAITDFHAEKRSTFNYLRTHFLEPPVRDSQIFGRGPFFQPIIPPFSAAGLILHSAVFASRRQGFTPTLRLVQNPGTKGNP